MVDQVARKRAKKPKFMTIFFIIAILAIIIFFIGISEFFKEPVVEETTTTVETTVETTTTEETTTTVSEVCDDINTRFRIRSCSYKNEELKIYIENLASPHIYKFNVKLYYLDKVIEIPYRDIDIAPKQTKIYTMDVGIGLDNVIVYLPGCPYDETSKYGKWHYWCDV